MANTKIPSELSSTPSIVDNGNATAITIDTSENVTLASGLDVNGVVNLNNLTVNTAQGTDGQVLTSTGSGIAWEDASGGGGGSGVLSGGTSIYMNSIQNIGRNVTTKLNFDRVVFGNSGTPFSTTNNNYTVPSAGKYLFLGQVNSANFTTGANAQQVLYVDIYKNGSSIHYDEVYNRSVSADVIRYKSIINHVADCASGDVIDFRARLSNFGATTTLDISNGSKKTFMYIVKIES